MYRPVRENPWFSPPALQYLARFNPPVEENACYGLHWHQERPFVAPPAGSLYGATHQRSNPSDPNQAWFLDPIGRRRRRGARSFKVGDVVLNYESEKCLGRIVGIHRAGGGVNIFEVEWGDGGSSDEHEEDLVWWAGARTNPPAWHAGGSHYYRGRLHHGAGRFHHHGEPASEWHAGGGTRYHSRWHPGGGHLERNPAYYEGPQPGRWHPSFYDEEEEERRRRLHGSMEEISAYELNPGCRNVSDHLECWYDNPHLGYRSSPHGPGCRCLHCEEAREPRVEFCEDCGWFVTERGSRLCRECKRKGSGAFATARNPGPFYMGARHHDEPRHDVLCQCGWGRMRMPESQIPEHCPVCDFPIGAYGRGEVERNPYTGEWVSVRGHEVPVSRSKGGRYHRLRVQDPDAFDVLRTKTLSEGKGIKALVGRMPGGERGPRGGRTEISSYLLDAERYSPEDAIRWAEGHKIPTPLLVDFSPREATQRRMAVWGEAPERERRERTKTKKKAKKRRIAGEAAPKPRKKRRRKIA